MIEDMRASRWVGLCLFFCAFTTVAAMQVPVTKDPRHRLVFENAQFRILDVNIPPGDASLDHLHEHDIVTVSMTPGTETRIETAGQPAGAVRPPRPLGDATVAEYTGKPQSHKVTNVGKTAYQLFAVENLRASGWTTSPALSDAATKITRESRAFKIYDVQLSLAHSQTSHTHAVPTIAVLLSSDKTGCGNLRTRMR